MRIVNEFNLGHVKCTLFHYNGKYNLKMEDELGEVHYKLGDINIDKPDEVNRLFDLVDLRDSVRKAFENLAKGRMQLMHLLSNQEEDFTTQIV